MADDIKIGLDGKPLQDAAKPAIDALRQLQSAISELDKNSSFARVNKGAKELLGTAKSLADGAASDLKKFENALVSSVERAGKEAKSRARGAGKEAGKELVAGLQEQVATASVRIAGPRLIMPGGNSASASGKGAAADAAVSAATQKLILENGARSAAQIAAEGAALREMQKVSNDTYRSINNWHRSNAVEAKKATRTEAEGIKEAQRQADFSHRIRTGWQKAGEAHDKLRAKEDLDSMREMQKVSNETYRSINNWQKSVGAESRRAAADEQTSSNLTFRARQAFHRAEDNQRQKNAAFAAQSPSGQLTAASRASAFIDGGGSEISAMGKYGSAAVLASRNLEELRVKQDLVRGSGRALSEEHRALAERSRDVHSAFRGIAGASGALFLTYGALLPLTTAFFAASAVRESIKAYKDLEYQIKFVQALQDGGAPINEAAVRRQLGTVAAGAGTDPVEAAKGMRLLAQSGLDAKEALQALPTVLKVATIGELDVATATETLTGAVHAFGLEMTDIGRVGDVFVKAGAISNTSVAKIAESMKQASTVAQQFNLTIEEVSTGLVALAKRNITGSAGGTAFRNMLTELATPSGEAKKISQKLGVDLFDPIKGTMNDFYGKFIPELRKKLEPLNPKSQEYILNKLTNERGSKALGAILGLTDADLADIKGQLDKAKGITDRATATLLDSVQGDFNKLKAALTSSFAEAGGAGSGDLRTALQGLQVVVQSPEFQGALANLVGLVAGIAKGFAALTAALFDPKVQMLAVGAAVLTSQTALAGLAAILPTSATALLGLGAGATAAAGASSLLATAGMTVLKVLRGFTVITGVVMLLGTLYSKLSEKSGTDAAIANGNRYIGNLRNQIAELDRLIAKKAQSDGMGNVSERMGLKGALVEAEKARDRQREARDRVVSSNPERAGMARPWLDQSDTKVQQLRQQLDTLNTLEIQRVAKQRTLDGRSTWDPKTGDKFDAMNAGLTGEAAAKANGFNPNQRVIGTQNFELPDTAGAGAAARKALKEAGADYKNMLKEVQNLVKGSRQLGESVDESMRVEEAALKQSYDRGVIGYDEYQKRLTLHQQEQVTVRTALAESERDAVQRGLKELELRAGKLGGLGKPGVPQQLTNDIESMTQQLNEAEGRVQKLINDHAVSQGAALTEALKPASDIIKNAEKSGAQDAERMRQEVEKLKLKGSGLELSEREMFVQGQILDITGKQKTKLSEAQFVMSEMVRTGAFAAEKLNDPDTYKVYEMLAKIIADLRGSTESASETIRGAAGQKFDNKQWESIEQRATSSIESSVKEGLTAGLTGDVQGLANFGKNLQKTVVQALVDAFYSSFLKKPIEDMARTVFSSLQSAATGGGGGSSGLGILSTVVGLLGGGTSTAATGITQAVGATAATYGSTSAIQYLGGFDGGGYTGAGAKLKPAGIVHAEEYVLNAKATKALGIPYLDYLNSLSSVKGYSEGGYVGQGYSPDFNESPRARAAAANQAASQQQAPPIVFSPVTSVQVDSRSDRAMVIADVQRVVGESQRQYTEFLKRMRIVPQ